MTGPNITQAMINAYDEYTHLTLDRRGFMERLTRLAGSGAAAAAIAPLLAASSARAAIVAEDDPKLKTETVTYKGSAGDMKGYLVRPAEQSGKLGTVIVIHENRGLNPHIQDIARRVALEGFVALAPDLLSPLGGTPPDEDKARDMIGQLTPAQAIADGRRRSPSSKAMTAATARSARSASAGAAAWSTTSPSTRRRSTPRSPITAASRRPRTSPRSRRRCCCTMPGSTSASTPASRPTRRL